MKTAIRTERYIYVALSALIVLLVLMPAVDAAVGEAFKIETEPMGAKIWIDGNYRGLSDKDTVFYSFETGDHLVRLELDGYEPYEVVKTVSEGASEIVYHKFKPIQTTGQIGFYSVPTGAEIYLDGRYVGKTPYTMDKVEPGTYTVVIKHRGYEDWTGSVNVEAGKLSEVNADMVLADVPISIKTQPEGFDLYIDGEYVGKTPYTGTISQGKHTFRAEKLGYRTVEETFYVGFEGVVRMYVPETTVLEAMAEVEATITANLKYNPALAKQLLRQAREAYDLKDYDTAINLTQQAMNAAEDVDLDGVKNADDIVAGIENSKIYVLPFIIAFVLIVLFAANFMRHRVKPVIVLEVPKALRAEGESPQYVKLSVDAKGGAYRAFVCTVYLDDESMEHFVEPGSYEVLIAGTHRTLGDHRVAVELKISKTRYGVTTARSEESYTVFDDENIIDSDSMSLIEGEGADGVGGAGIGGKSKPKRFDLGALFSGTSGASGTKGKASAKSGKDSAKDSKKDSKKESRKESKTDTGTESKKDSAKDSKTESKTDTKTDSAKDKGKESKADTKAAAKSDAKTDTKADTKPDAPKDAATESKTEKVTESSPESTTEKGDAKKDAKTDAKSDEKSGEKK